MKQKGFILRLLLSAICALGFTCIYADGYADEQQPAQTTVNTTAQTTGQTTIDAESLEYITETTTYILKGAVKIRKADAAVEADEIQYNETTSEAVATGNVRYHSADFSITAGKAELNLADKTGTLHDAEVLYKKTNFHISGKIIEKKGDDYYTSPEATFTTCDAPIPAWCFHGKDVNALVTDRLNAKDATFRLKNIPVLYSPFLWAPMLSDRQTGFLVPLIGYSNTRGFNLKIPFYWAISENRDATFELDTYTKRGIGEGLEYRYIEPWRAKGDWWIYHIRDTELNKDFFEIKGLHDQRSANALGGFLNVNYINENDFYREFKTDLQTRTNRFLESTGELTMPFSNARAYLLSRYWVDLKNDTKSAAQKLPEAGYVFNPAKIGQFWFSATTAFSNFWREEYTDGQRVDLYPTIMHKFGTNALNFRQTLGLRETAYSLNNGQDGSLHRESLDYQMEVNTRLYKKYNAVTHIVEPSISYTLLYNTENALPVFDSTELFKRKSLIELSLLNRFINKDGEFLVVRAAQGFDSFQGDRPFQPLHFEIGLKKPVAVRLETYYDVHTGRVESVNSDLSMTVAPVTFSAGERYNVKNDIKFYTTGLGLHFWKPLYMNINIWYDAIEHRTKDVTAHLKYIGQCWGVDLGFVKRPGEFAVSLLFELKGITGKLK
jgi:LPS-assembly protein